jgi:Tfp pilus assembly protein PilV
MKMSAVNKIFKTYKNQKGIGLIEVIAALGISVIAITALVSLALYTMRLSLQSKLELMGAEKATREREMLRAYRDRSTSWASFINGISVAHTCNTGCYMDTSALTPVNGTNSETVEGSITLNRGFVATVDAGDSNIVHVTVTVSWNIGGQARSTHLYTYLTNWLNN